jgi:ankyrin repeat protein
MLIFGVIPERGHRRLVSFLLKHGADVNFRGSDLSTPLHTRHFAKSEVVQLLLESGADVHSRDDKGRTPLHMVPPMRRTKKLKLEKLHDYYWSVART